MGRAPPLPGVQTSFTNCCRTDALADGVPHPQLPLDFAPRDGATFDDFVPGESGLTVDLLRHLADGDGERQALLWGVAGSGKSHLLNAACQRAAGRGERVAMLPLGELFDATADGAPGPELLDGLESLALVCLDDLQRVAGRDAWEEALFDLINRARDGGCRMLFACDDNPAALGLSLPDLRSRLAWGPVLRLRAADDTQLAEILSRRAAALGLDLGEGVLRYLMTRYARDLRAALARLQLLDHASLAAQRRLTVPFVKSVLG